MFKKILIANRGEIACRVMKTARKMGIKTVAVFSEADRFSRHVQLADEAIFIGPAPSRESYLVIDKIIDACRQTGAEAVHPGYGFLSENQAFALRLEQEGIVFIGPRAHAIAAMGDKIESKKLAQQAGVSTIPGYLDAIASPEQAVDIANNIGYPVMIKASAGGGGKGLRVAWDDVQTHEGFISCQNEARASFGDDRIFIEKFVEQPRHIEIQVLGDAHGHVLYLWERECSIQRRHQKVIEEAPSPFLDEATRQAMGAQAVALAKAVNYQSAGTVEFVVGHDRRFYFLEMNTRLQVEHPVTEMITGLDLVEQMICVAAGEPLQFTQDQVQLKGWAIETRICAEEPTRNFLPSTGRLIRYQPPQEMDAVRVDTGVTEGGEVSMFYDSMIAKLIVHADTRQAAIEKMKLALNAFVIRGVSQNILFLSSLLHQPAFARGEFTTGFIEQNYAQGFNPTKVDAATEDTLSVIAAIMNYRYLCRAAGIVGQLESLAYQVPHDYCVVIPAEEIHNGQTSQARQRPIRVEEVTSDEYHVSFNDGKTHCVRTDWRYGDYLFCAQYDGLPVYVQVERRNLNISLSMNGLSLSVMVLTRSAARMQALMLDKAKPDLSKFLLSPMPGLLRDIAVAVGQRVKAGEKLAVIEAMKMENVLRAEQDGVVAEIHVKQGDSLSVDQVMVTFE